MTDSEFDALADASDAAYKALSLCLRALGELAIGQPDGNIKIGKTNREEYAKLKAAHDDAWAKYRAAISERYINKNEVTE